jgi:hypothetical protein
MLLLIGNQPSGFGKGYDDDGDSPPIEFIFGRSHLAKVMLARQSRKVPEKNQQ